MIRRYNDGSEIRLRKGKENAKKSEKKGKRRDWRIRIENSKDTARNIEENMMREGNWEVVGKEEIQINPKKLPFIKSPNVSI